MKWTNDDKHEVVEAIVDGMVADMTFDQMRQLVWDVYYDDLIGNEWVDLLMHAEQYAPELLEGAEGDG